MKFNGKAGQELRTWILFFVGITLVLIFAMQKNPLNPWWTLIIGAFTCTAIIVSAVQSLIGGVNNAAQKEITKTTRLDAESMVEERSEKRNASSISSNLGHRILGSFCVLRRCNASSV